LKRNDRIHFGRSGSPAHEARHGEDDMTTRHGLEHFLL
jgi:hypothetical protein